MSQVLTSSSSSSNAATASSNATNADFPSYSEIRKPIIPYLLELSKNIAFTINEQKKKALTFLGNHNTLKETTITGASLAVECALKTTWASLPVEYALKAAISHLDSLKPRNLDEANFAKNFRELSLDFLDHKISENRFLEGLNLAEKDFIVFINKEDAMSVGSVISEEDEEGWHLVGLQDIIENENLQDFGEGHAARLGFPFVFYVKSKGYWTKGGCGFLRSELIDTLAGFPMVGEMSSNFIGEKGSLLQVCIRVEGSGQSGGFNDKFSSAQIPHKNSYSKHHL